MWNANANSFIHSKKLLTLRPKNSNCVGLAHSYTRRRRQEKQSPAESFWRAWNQSKRNLMTQSLRHPAEEPGASFHFTRRMVCQWDPRHCKCVGSTLWPQGTQTLAVIVRLLLPWNVLEWTGLILALIPPFLFPFRVGQSFLWQTHPFFTVTHSVGGPGGWLTWDLCLILLLTLYIFSVIYHVIRQLDPQRAVLPPAFPNLTQQTATVCPRKDDGGKVGTVFVCEGSYILEY